MKSVAELNAVRAKSLKSIVLRKGAEAMANVQSDCKYNVLVCGGT